MMKQTMVKKTVVSLLAVVVVVGLGMMVSPMVHAQTEGGDNTGARASGGDNNNRQSRWGTPEEMQQRIEEMRNRMNDAVKEQLGFTDAEWEQVKPMYTKVADLTRQLNRPGRGMMMGGWRGRRGGGDNAQGNDSSNRPSFSMPGDDSALGKARQKLEEVVKDTNAPAGDIKAALDAYRTERAKAQQDLDKAKAELREVLSVRQEAILVSYGLLD
ncbi:MAG: hypothetical protein GC164_14325 [Phycisphaera sp.]|nr:hypothetical protein [Phycisphaera sp.]